MSHYIQTKCVYTLDRFVSAIIAKDMGDIVDDQRQQFGKCVINKLPIDSVSQPNKSIFFSQLLQTIGDIGDKIYWKCEECFSDDSQDQIIFSASAASGTGKTH
mmetsp:Transcript_15951/g.24038  ORF Transcript_15951/g.24038 Transcript_15951/m.24038 type:complete len:103 (+) Transcript_15951:57-365(+)